MYAASSLARYHKPAEPFLRRYAQVLGPPFSRCFFRIVYQWRFLRRRVIARWLKELMISPRFRAVLGHADVAALF